MSDLSAFLDDVKNQELKPAVEEFLKGLAAAKLDGEKKIAECAERTERDFIAFACGEISQRDFDRIMAAR